MRCKYLFLLLFLVQSAIAQDAHYWTEQYGTRSMLLSNSIFGSVQDLGAVFYNPARLSLIEENAFLISGKVYQLNTYNFKTSSDNGRSSPQTQSSFGGVPSLLAGTYRINGWDKHSFAYSFLSRRRMDLTLTESTSAYGNVLPEIPGEEYFSGDVGLNKKFNEEWLGLSWAFQPNDHFSIGVSNFVTIRKQSAFDRLIAQAYTEAQDVETYNNLNSYNYSHVGLLWKIGLAWEKESWMWGLTLTTPTVTLSGDGAFKYDRVYTGINDGQPIYEQYSENKISAIYKTPFSIAAGVGVNLKKGSIHASGEYFGAIDEYTLMTGSVFTGQSTGNDYQASLIDELNAVFNFGLGYHYIFNERFNAYVSFSTDYSAAVGNIDANANFTEQVYASTFNSNIYHYGGGVVMNLKRANITFGATLSTATYQMDRPLGFPSDTGPSLRQSEATTDINWRRWRFIVGVSIPFLNDWVKKWEDKLQGEKSN